MLTKSLILSICLFAAICAPAQDPDDGSKRLEEKYQRIKDSLALLYPSIPAVSSILIKKKQVEVNLYSSLLSANRYRNDDGDLTDYNFREIYLFNTVQVNYGVSDNDRVNIGLGVQSVTGRIDENRNASVFRIFSSNTDGNSLYASAVTAILPRIRWRPFKTNYNFTLQSSFSVPTSISTRKQNILGRSQLSFLNQFIYNQPLSDRFFLLSQLSIQYGFKRTNTPAVLYTPLSAYLSYFIPRKTVFFGLLNYIPIFIEGSNRHTFQTGGGIQYQLSRNVLVNGFYANDVLGKNYPNFATCTIGLRVVSN